MLLDLDGFKAINDTFGHPVGDRVLVEVARALSATVREQDTLARQGGDEFSILAPATGEEGAVALAMRVRDAVAIATRDSVATSVGWVIDPARGEDASDYSRSPTRNCVAPSPTAEPMDADEQPTPSRASCTAPSGPPGRRRERVRRRLARRIFCTHPE